MTDFWGSGIVSRTIGNKLPDRYPMAHTWAVTSLLWRYVLVAPQTPALAPDSAVGQFQEIVHVEVLSSQLLRESR